MRALVLVFVIAGFIFALPTTYLYLKGDVDGLHAILAGLLGGFLFGGLLGIIAMLITRGLRRAWWSFLILSIILTISGLFAGAFLWFPLYESFFGPWERIANPPEQVSEIITAGLYTVWVQTTPENVYECDRECTLEIMSASALSELRTSATRYRPADFNAWMLPSPPGKIVVAHETTYEDTGANGNLIVAIMEDGSMWRTREVLRGEWTGLLLYFWAVLGGFAGLVSGFTALWKKVWRKVF